MLFLSHICGHIIHLFFLHLLYSLLFSLLKKKKKKLLPSLLVHICCYTSSNLLPPSLPLSPHYSLLYRYFSIFSFLYFDSFSPYFILYKFDITSYIQSIFFQQKNCEYSRSLSLSLGGFFFFLITLIKDDFFFFNNFKY